MSTYDLPIVDWITGDPLKGLTVLQCAKMNPSCTQPLGSMEVQDDRLMADVSIELPSDFGSNNFIKIVSTDGIVLDDNNEPDFTQAYVPVTIYFGDTTHGDRTVSPAIRLLRQPFIQELASSIQAVLDFDLALVVTRVLDCKGDPAEGVRFEISYSTPNANPLPYTILDGLVQRPETDSGFLPTDLNGEAGFANVPTGNIRVQAIVDNTGQRIGPAGGAGATALANQVTFVEIHANPFGAASAALATEQ